MFVRPCTFCNKAGFQGTHKNFDQLHQYIWLANTKLWQLVAFINKFCPNVENMKLTQNMAFSSMFVKLYILVTKLIVKAHVKIFMYYANIFG